MFTFSFYIGSYIYIHLRLSSNKMLYPSDTNLIFVEIPSYNYFFDIRRAFEFVSTFLVYRTGSFVTGKHDRNVLGNLESKLYYFYMSLRVCAPAFFLFIIGCGSPFIGYPSFHYSYWYSWELWYVFFFFFILVRGWDPVLTLTDRLLISALNSA